MQDWRGTEIEVGDTILYSVKQSCDVEINEATVTAIGNAPKYSWYSWSDLSDTIPIVKATWIRSNGGAWAEKWRVNRKVTLRTLENITVIKKGNNG
jgi:hypothetical protein